MWLVGGRWTEESVANYPTHAHTQTSELVDFEKSSSVPGTHRQTARFMKTGLNLLIAGTSHTLVGKGLGVL